MLAKAFNTTATIYRKSQTHDNTGGMVDTYTDIGTYPCLLLRSLITPRERENAVTIVAESFWQFSLPARTDVRNTDHIVCQGRTFEVVGGGSGSIDLATRVICIELT